MITFYLNKMDLVLHCHEETNIEKLNNGRRRVHKEEKREPLAVVPSQHFFQDSHSR